MPYAFTVSEPSVEHIDGTKFATWTITETGEAIATSEWEIPGVPSPAELWLVVSDLSGTVDTTIQPEFGLQSGWASQGAGHIVQAGSAGKNHRINGNQRWASSDGGSVSIHGRSAVALPLGSDGLIVTTVTIRQGG